MGLACVHKDVSVLGREHANIIKRTPTDAVLQICYKQEVAACDRSLHYCELCHKTCERHPNPRIKDNWNSRC